MPFPCYDDYDQQFYDDYINSQRVKQQQKMNQSRTSNRPCSWMKSNCNDNSIYNHSQSINIPIQRESPQDTRLSTKQTTKEDSEYPPQGLYHANDTKKRAYREIPITRVDSKTVEPESTHVQKQRPKGEREEKVEQPQIDTQSTGKQPEPNVFEIIEKIQNEVDELSCQVDNFSGTAQDKQYRFLDEMLTRCLINLDAIEVQGRDDVRQARKLVVNTINKAVGLLESKIGKASEKEDHSNWSSQTNEIEISTANDSIEEPATAGDVPVGMNTDPEELREEPTTSDNTHMEVKVDSDEAGQEPDSADSPDVTKTGIGESSEAPTVSDDKANDAPEKMITETNESNEEPILNNDTPEDMRIDTDESGKDPTIAKDESIHLKTDANEFNRELNLS